jgi:hypothetical protein
LGRIAASPEISCADLGHGKCLAPLLAHSLAVDGPGEEGIAQGADGLRLGVCLGRRRRRAADGHGRRLTGSTVGRASLCYRLAVASALIPNRVTALTTARSEAVRMLASIPTPQATVPFSSAAST